MRFLPFGRGERSKKQRLVRLAARIESFLIAVWSKKLLVVTTSVFLATGYYAINFTKGLSEDPSEDLREKELKATEGMQDVHRYTDTLNKLQTFLESFEKFTQYTTEVSSGVEKLPNPTDKSQYLIRIPQLKIALTKAKEARSSLASAIAAVKTSTFQLPEFVDFFKGYEEDLRDIDKMIAYYEKYYQSVIDLNVSDLAEVVKQIGGYMYKYKEAVEAFHLRYAASLERANNINTSLDIRLEHRDRDDRIILVRFLILFFLIFLTSFLAVLTYRSRQTIKPHSLLLGGRPDIRKAQQEKYAFGRQNRHR